MSMRSDDDEALLEFMTHEEMHEWGLHDSRAEVECNYCRQLFDSTHDEAVAEAIERGLDLL